MYQSHNHDFTLLHGDTFKLLPQFSFKFDMIFADPPYFLSNGGISCQAGKVVSVDKGTWAKTNPPPNISCRYFTYSTEFIIWARKMPKVPHFYNYELMKQLNEGKQMTDVWRLPAIGPWEKSCGKHPTQKPLALLSRIILASTKPHAWVLDPFAGSSTTGIAANLLQRRYLGIEQEPEFIALSERRRRELEDEDIRCLYLSKIKDLKHLPQDMACHDDEPPEYGNVPF